MTTDQLKEFWNYDLYFRQKVTSLDGVIESLSYFTRCFQLGRPLQRRLILNERVAICARVLFASYFISISISFNRYQMSKSQFVQESYLPPKRGTILFPGPGCFLQNFSFFVLHSAFGRIIESYFEKISIQAKLRKYQKGLSRTNICINWH